MSALVEQAVQHLGDEIVNGKYPGNVLPPQDVLCVQVGMSRTTIREAVSVLSARAMLHVQPKVGTQIVPARNWKMIDADVVKWRVRAQQTDAAFLRDLAGFQALVAPAAAAQAALHASDVQRTAISSAYHALLLAADPVAFSEANGVFHKAIVRASGNQIIEQLTELVCVARPISHEPWRAEHIRAERKIVTRLMASIDARDAALAWASMSDLLGFGGGGAVNARTGEKCSSPAVVT
jgi:DNA-binding FadR family transcriptional regulator